MSARQFVWDKLNYESLEKYAESTAPLRRYFADEVIGRCDEELPPPNVRSRWVAESDRWTRYEVVLDALPGVIAYGLLTLPKEIKPGEKRPVVVCQHGLERAAARHDRRAELQILRRFRHPIGRAWFYHVCARRICTSSTTASAACSGRPIR